MVDHTKNAYMLIYEKRRKEPLKIKIPDELIQKEEAEALAQALPSTASKTTNPLEKLIENGVPAVRVVPQLPKLCPEIDTEKLRQAKLLFD